MDQAQKEEKNRPNDGLGRLGIRGMTEAELMDRATLVLRVVKIAVMAVREDGERGQTARK